jgi:hypothetical protein
MDLLRLKKHERYLFCKQKNDGSLRYFRANFLGLYGMQQLTVLICHQRDEQRGVTNFHMDADNVVTAETLVNIFENHPCKLPDDVLHIINSFW